MRGAAAGAWPAGGVPPGRGVGYEGAPPTLAARAALTPGPLPTPGFGVAPMGGTP